MNLKEAGKGMRVGLEKRRGGQRNIVTKLQSEKQTKE